MPDPVTAMVGSTLVGASSARSARKSGEAAAAGQERTAAEAQALNIERYGEARGMLDPYVEDERRAREQYMIEMGLAPGEAGTAYMESPGYKAGMKGVEQQMSQAGTLYSGARIGASEQAQGQFYNNYMGMLQNLGSPSTATNLASLGVGQAATIGQQNIASQQVAGQTRMAGAAAEQAFVGDVIGGGANIYGGYLASQGPSLGTPPPTAAYGDAYQPAQQAGYI